MLGRFGATSLVSAAYTVGSLLSFVMLFLAPRAVRQLGLVRATSIVLLVSSTILIGLGTSTSVIPTIALFVLYFSLNSVIAYLFDLFVEHYSLVSSTGSTRGLYLTITNLGWVGAPVLAGFLSTQFGFGRVYIVGGAIVLLTMLIIIGSQRQFVDKEYTRIDFRHALARLRQLPGIRRIVTLNFMLQFFFAWMVIYSPVYLHQAGFTIKQIGAIFSIMLVPYILFQYPIGKLADRFGEARLMRAGLIIAAGATLCFVAFGDNHTVVFYAVILFLTRIGASIIEVCCDSYFFRQVTEADASLVSLYRAMLPLAYILGPLSGVLVLYFFSYKILFIILAGLLALGALYSNRLKRTY
jgi:MFS family permease